jgi:hypothetical protein
LKELGIEIETEELTSKMAKMISTHFDNDHEIITSNIQSEIIFVQNILTQKQKINEN